MNTPVSVARDIYATCPNHRTCPKNAAAPCSLKYGAHEYCEENRVARASQEAPTLDWRRPMH